MQVTQPDTSSSPGGAGRAGQRARSAPGTLRDTAPGQSQRRSGSSCLFQRNNGRPAAVASHPAHRQLRSDPQQSCAAGPAPARLRGTPGCQERDLKPPSAFLRRQRPGRPRHSRGSQSPPAELPRAPRAERPRASPSATSVTTAALAFPGCEARRA